MIGCNYLLSPASYGQIKFIKKYLIIFKTIKMKANLIKTVLSLSLLLAAIGSLKAQEVSLDNFNKLVVNTSTEVILNHAENNSYSIEPNGSHLSMEVNNGTLTVSTDKSKQFPKKVYINCKNISHIEVLGSSDISTANEFSTENIELRVVGSGSIAMKLKAQKLVANVEGSGAMNLAGSSDEIKAQVSGSGDIIAENMMAQNAEAAVFGSGDIVLNAQKQLRAEVLGSGSIKYIGKPEISGISITGSGSISETQIGHHNESNTSTISVESNTGDTTKLSLGNRKIIIIEDEDEKEKQKSSTKSIKNIWAGFELGFNAYSNNMFNTSLTGTSAYSLDYLRSNVINLNLIERNISLYKNNISLTTGLGFQFNRFMFDNNYNHDVYHDSIHTYLAAHSYAKNMIKASYLTVPLLLHFNTNEKNNKSFHFAIGVQGGLKLGSRQKQVYTLRGADKRDILKSNLNLNPFQYGLTARIGYGKVNLFANYNLSELYKSGKGPKLYPFQVGITLIPF